MATLPLTNNMKMNQYKNQRIQPGHLQNLPNKAASSLSHAVPASQMVSPQGSPKVAHRFNESFNLLSGSTSGVGPTERSLERSQFNKTSHHQE